MTLYAATTNKGKLAEFTAAAAATHGITIAPLPNLANLPEPVEDANTFMGNAELKAIAYSHHAPGLLVFADDSGLEVDALNNQPGVRSARFADDANYATNSGRKIDDRNNELLLDRLKFTSAFATRTARFVCTLALARDGQILLRAEGTVTGEILPAPRGTAGFGYDPLFLIPSLDRTLAEIPRDQKWHLSHRGNAFRNLLAQLSDTPTLQSQVL